MDPQGMIPIIPPPTLNVQVINNYAQIMQPRIRVMVIKILFENQLWKVRRKLVYGK